MARRDRPPGPDGARGGFGGAASARAAVAAGLLAALCGGCHLLVDFRDLPPTGATSPLGTCTDAEPGVPELEIRLGLNFVQNNGMPAGTELEVKACPIDATQAPLSCAEPLTPVVNPDASGHVDLLISPDPDLAKPYLPYVRVEKEGLYFPTSILTWPVIERSANLPPLIAISETIVEAITELTMIDRDAGIEERGHLIVVVTDCSGAPARDIEVFVDESARDESTIAFTRGSDTVPDFYRSVTDDDGIVVYLGLPAAQDVIEVPLQLRDAFTRQDLVQGAISIPVRRGEATMVLVAPWLANSP